MNEALIFKVKKLLEKGNAYSETYSIDADAEMDELVLKAPLTGSLTLMHVEDGINAQFEDFQTVVELECERCLKKFDAPVTVNEAERDFTLEAPLDIDDPNDIFLIEPKTFKIDITEPLRQEIILHFPAIPVCSSGCKGICHLCGADRNQKNCDCKEDEPEENKPLAALKDLLKDN